MLRGYFARPCLPCRGLIPPARCAARAFSSRHHLYGGYDEERGASIKGYRSRSSDRDHEGPSRQSHFKPRDSGSSYGGRSGKSQPRNDRSGLHEFGRSRLGDTESYQREPFRRDGLSHSSEGSSRAHAPIFEKRRTADAKNIPFEHSAGKKMLPTDTASMTPRERAVFARLFRMLPNPAPSISPGQDGGVQLSDSENTTKDLSLDNSDTANDEVEGDSAGHREGMESVSTEHDVLVELELARVRKAFDDAKTDVDLCEVLMVDVVCPAVALDLENFTAVSQISVLTSKDGPGNETANTAPKRSDPGVFSRAFSQHLLSFLDVMSKKFPSSMMWDVLPMIQSLGPATFALGGSTALYNAHMFMVWHKFRDCQRIIDLLEEMDRNVYLYDSGTHRLVVHILEEISHQRTGFYGEVVRDLCRPSIEQVNRLSAIKGQIQEQREEEALRAARAQDREADAVGGWENEGTRGG